MTLYLTNYGYITDGSSKTSNCSVRGGDDKRDFYIVAFIEEMSSILDGEHDHICHSFIVQERVALPLEFITGENYHYSG